MGSRLPPLSKGFLIGYSILLLSITIALFALNMAFAKYIRQKLKHDGKPDVDVVEHFGKAWYCGISLFKLFGLKTDIHTGRNVLPPDYSRHALLIRRQVIGFLDHEMSEGLLTRAPCLVVRLSAPNLDALQDQIANAIRQRGARTRVPGPFHALIANNNDTRNIDAYLYFPSVTKDGRNAPNFDARARAHRWVSRLTNGFQYTLDPAFRTWDGSPSHVRTCFGTRELSQDVHPCTTEHSYIACGCVGAGCTPKPKYTDPKMKRASYNSVFIVYEVNLNHPAIRPYLLRNGVYSLERNMLPYRLELTSNFTSALISRNHASSAYIRGNAFTVNGAPVLVTNGAMVSVTLDGTSLTAETATGDQAVMVAAAGGDTPYTLVIQDWGALRVFDRFNKDVTSQELKAANARILAGDPNALKKEMENDGNAMTYDPTKPWDPWDPAAEYQRRIQNLSDFLRLRNLLFNYDPTLFTKPLIKVAAIQTMYGTYDTEDDFPFDANANYRERILDLVHLLRSLGYNVQNPTDPIVLPASRGTANLPSESGSTTDETAIKKADQYDANTEYTNRLRDLERLIS